MIGYMESCMSKKRVAPSGKPALFLGDSEIDHQLIIDHLVIAHFGAPSLDHMITYQAKCGM